MQTLTHSQAHAPGPWCCTPGEFFSVYSYEGGEPTAVPKTEANAALIAAAPELLEAIRALLAVANVRIDDPRIVQFDACRAAIAKAESGAA